MRKVTEPFQRPNKKGYWIRWIENGKQIHKSFTSRKEAEHYRHIQYMRLNSDVYTNINLPFDEAKKEYLVKYDIQRLSRYTKCQATKIINNFWNICRPLKTNDVSQRLFDFYLAYRSKSAISAWSINREAKTLIAFFTFLNKNGYLRTRIEFKRLKTMQPKSKALTDDQIKSLLKACPHQEWRLRILLGLCTGLRKNDLYRIKTADIDLTNGTIAAQERKTGKTYTNYIPDKLMPLIKAHTPNNPYFFNVVNSRWLDKQFRKFRPNGITIQSLRKTFATRIETTSISSQMLNHSGTAITRQFYNDLDYIKYIRVNQLPIELWME